MAELDVNDCRQYLQKLKIEDQRVEALNEIKKLLTFKGGETAKVLKENGLFKICHCLSSQDKTQIVLVCDLLKLCADHLNVGEIITDCTGLVMYMLRHEHTCIRLFAIDQVHKSISSDPQLLPVKKFVDLFVAIGQLVMDKDTGVANKAVLVTSNLQPEAYPKVLEEMKIALEHDSSSKSNAFEVVINISTKTPELLQLCAGYISYLVSELQSTDTLYVMNILELLSRLSITRHGFKFLLDCGALKIISESITNLKNNPLGNLLIPGYLKFFSSIAYLYPKEIFERYPVLLEALFHAFDSDDPTVMMVALDTLGFIGNTVEGKLSLAALGSKYTSTVSRVGELIKTGTTDIKIRALHCFANLIAYDKDPTIPATGDVDHRVILMTREWFRSLSSNPDSMAVVQDICKNPFPDIKLAGFQLLDAVCQYHWGEDLVAKCPGFIEYLMDRTVDYTKEAKEAKYEILKKLSQSTAFDSTILLRLKKYAEEGPFYSETVMQVAMEEGEY